MAFSTACDRVRAAGQVVSVLLSWLLMACAHVPAAPQAFPPTVEGGSQNYQVCLQYLDGSCQDTCAAFNK